LETDHFDQLMEQLREVHTQGGEAHQLFLEARAQGNTAAMGVANAEHQALVATARELTTHLRAVVDAQKAQSSSPKDT
jgi:hypothetical protein